MDKSPLHPGEVLAAKYLEPRGITQAALARHVGLSEKTVHQIVHGRRAVTPHTAWLLAHALGTTPEYWMELQSAWSLARHVPRRKVGRLESSTAQPLLPGLEGGAKR